MIPQLVHYLEELSLNLKLDPRQARSIVREMYTHLDERVRDLRQQGIPSDEAVKRAIQEFGRPENVAREMCEVHDQGSWTAGLLAGTPHLLVAFLFTSRQWQDFRWLAFFLTVAVGVTIFAWWKGKPVWMYPWAGYSLSLPLATSAIAVMALVQGGLLLSRGSPTPVPVWVYLGLVAYVPMGLWMVISTSIKVAKRDWIFASLMVLPFPILVRWLMSLQVDGQALVYNRPSFWVAGDSSTALAFLALAMMAVVFVHLKQRKLKVVLLVMATPAAFLIAAQSIPGSPGLLALLVFATLSGLFMLTPALFNQKSGTEERSIGPWLGEWFNSR